MTATIKKLDALPESPEHIVDIAILTNALYTLEILEEENGRPYVFEYVQQPMIGGTCHPVPIGLPFSRNGGSKVIGTYDKRYIGGRIKELRKQEYLH